MCSDKLSGTLTKEVAPSKDHAPPYVPPATHVALVAAPLLPLPDASRTLVLLLSNEYAATRPVVAAAVPVTPAVDNAAIVARPQRIVRRREATRLSSLALLRGWACCRRRIVASFLRPVRVNRLSSARRVLLGRRARLLAPPGLALRRLAVLVLRRQLAALARRDDALEVRMPPLRHVALGRDQRV